MEWLLLALAAGATVPYAARRVRDRRAERRGQVEVLDEMRRLAEEDVTVFGEQLQRLDGTVAESVLDADARHDYQSALDAYERAKWDAPRMQHPDEISRLVDTLATGRYAVACVQASLAGRPRPQLRTPCFFNPQHGPSARTVMWTSARHGSRQVPACTRCATQLAAHEKPEVRTVTIGSRTVPYWEAGASLSPYSRGYFPADTAGTGSAMAWMYAAPDLWTPPHQHDHGGHGGGFDGGGFDGGGGDGGGGGGGD
ncbi:hypothetical protein [Nocardioides renjunii]|uniref:hypothetical protein n=1 Tax=Nocardioides renjunii TaxID=3095075 RepID=UPI002B001D87|nr:hypothetical protein [Nocardioides sp. S-34]WQQ20379.1 hypothetical protein SHK17_10685 [Nocardioides sp. S-34]